jgi:hypothetical protein
LPLTNERENLMEIHQMTATDVYEATRVMLRDRVVDKIGGQLSYLFKFDAEIAKILAQQEHLRELGNNSGDAIIGLVHLYRTCIELVALQDLIERKP